MSFFVFKGFNKLQVLSLVLYTFWVNVFVADLKNSWNFSYHLMKYLYRQNRKEFQIQQQYLSLNIYFCLQNIVLNNDPKVRYQLIARTMNLLLVLCWNYNLIVLVGDCAIFCFLMITKTCFPFEVSLKRSYSKVNKAIQNFLSVYNYHALLLMEIKVFHVYVTVVLT